MKVFIIACLALLTIFASCKRKDSCELNHTGDIYITNANDVDVEVRINGKKAFSLTPDQTKYVTQPVGTYSISCVSMAQIKDYPEVKVKECEKVEITVNFYE